MSHVGEAFWGGDRGHVVYSWRSCGFNSHTRLDTCMDSCFGLPARPLDAGGLRHGRLGRFAMEQDNPGGLR
jgi:hypothetical protein